MAPTLWKSSRLWRSPTWLLRKDCSVTTGKTTSSTSSRPPTPAPSSHCAGTVPIQPPWMWVPKIFHLISITFYRALRNLLFWPEQPVFITHSASDNLWLSFYYRFIAFLRCTAKWGEAHAAGFVLISQMRPLKWNRLFFGDILCIMSPRTTQHFVFVCFSRTHKASWKERAVFHVSGRICMRAINFSSRNCRRM